MNYNIIFSVAARTAETHAAIQRYIRYECPVLEQRLKRHALIIAIACLEFTIACFDWAQSQIEQSPEYRLRLQLAQVRTHRYCIRQAIKVEKARIAFTPRLTAAIDTIFALN